MNSMGEMTIKQSRHSFKGKRRLKTRKRPTIGLKSKEACKTLRKLSEKLQCQIQKLLISKADL
jgi:hypothetical protein